jgi:hypothetical protein
MKAAAAALLLLALASSASAQLINPGGPNGPCVEQPDGTCITIQRPMPPPQQPQQFPQQYGNYMLCYSNQPVPDTRNMFISNVFPSNLSTGQEEATFDQFASQQRYNVTFTCESGDFQSLQREVGQITVNMANRGYNINQIRHR